ncbi:hypothetical protein N825_32200 [Skermanella stibiiresistens SB22]|uniref:Uncharacterized protein n=1 Tax=Skermanella stibiiresistens SB22 TaxID=1385369 RepID=W9GPU3_9PROT|nr:hypothetical protein N825_32200 [Skermanella stibiiresistens SB22]
MAATFKTCKKTVLSAQSHWPDAALHHIGIHFHPAVVEVEAQRHPAAERIADRLRQFGAARQALEFLLEPGLQLSHLWGSLGLPDLSALIGRAAADAVLDCVEPGNAAQRVGRDRGAAFGQVVEASAGMAPAGSQHDPVAGSQPLARRSRPPAEPRGSPAGWRVAGICGIA